MFPSLVQLEHGVSDTGDPRRRVVCSERYRRRDGEGEDSKRPVTEIEEACASSATVNACYIPSWWRHHLIEHEDKLLPVILSHL